MTYHPSSIELSTCKRSVILRFVPPAYELTLCDDALRVYEKVTISGGQLRQVALDMRPVEVGKVRLTYAARHVLVEVDGKLFARVLDVDFIRLHSAASNGSGESIPLNEAFGLH